ncbi:MAG: hypothetical protein HGA44_16895, partial [Cellulomonadaceae bacterium]|nr:hypothetical protein [Cellulomonadaceae bacterium]
MSAARTFAKGTRRLGMNRAIAMVGTGSLLGALVLLGAMPAAPAAAAGDTADYSQW